MNVAFVHSVTIDWKTISREDPSSHDTGISYPDNQTDMQQYMADREN